MTVREKKFVKAKLEGLSNTKAAMVATGTKSINSAKTQGHRLSTKPEVQNALEKALKKHDITIDRLTGVVSDALSALKDIYSKDGTFIDSMPDHGTRLSATKIGLDLLKVTTKEPENFVQSREIIKGSDEVELQRAVFKRVS